ncbi:MAG: M6 family metalloprotease domain-containing protein, partial [Proteobacteria bacterium]|nr:M6 family metalloprotease domain-containing protein [Pseudomonadota bacterium]
PVTGFPLEPPRPGEIDQYRQDGSLAERMEFVHSLLNHRFHPSLIERKTARMKALQDGVDINNIAVQSFPYKTGLPSHGKPKIFVLLIEFPDYPHTQDKSVFENKLFGSGILTDVPYESLKSYYSRSSYGQLAIEGTVFDWYRAKHRRKFYGRESKTLWYSGPRNLIKEALSYHASSHDFSPYDNNGDGVIDYFIVIWTGPDEGWGSNWWAWCDSRGRRFEKDSFTIGGKKLGVFSWQWEKNEKQGEPEYTPQTTIHETGHALGLPDYYDYDEKQGPNGGVGGLDMMDANQYDHNCFSKWMLDWLEPAFITSGRQTLSLRPAADFTDCVAIMPGTAPLNIFSEFFMVQYRNIGTGNDYVLPGYGFLIWHVDARLDDKGADFKYDNSYTEHKLLRLMEADGLEQIETGEGLADFEDFYVPFTGKEFSSDTTPNSNNYAGVRTDVAVKNIAADAFTFATMTAQFIVGDDLPPVTGRPVIDSFTASPDSGNSPLTVTFTCEARVAPGQAALYIWDFNGDYVEDSDTYVQTTSFTYYYDPGIYYAHVMVVDGNGQQSDIATTTVTVY